MKINVELTSMSTKDTLTVIEAETTLPLSSRDNIKISPSTLHLMTLRSKRSRKTVASQLNQIVRIFGHDKHETFDWIAMKPVDIDVVIETLLEIRKMKPRTVNSYLAAIRGVFRAAYMNGIVNNETYHRIQQIRNVKAETIAKGRKPIKKEAVKILVEHCLSLGDAIGFRDATIISLLAGSGLRRDELVNIKLKDYDSSLRKFVVTGKGNKERTVDIPPNTCKRLNEWIDKYRGALPGYIFCSINKWGQMNISDNSPLSGNAIYDLLKKRTKELSHDHVRPHGLRRFCGTNMLKNGIDLVVVRDVLGHNSISTTQIYIENDEAELQKAVELNDI
ncbi:tyrosine-type recombinase/integrase [Alteromonas gracilis]|uniref:tyrosine-type recombinase/integrase n=1 Tax=Alteromonas gracilis TaxID=1479524 RepID=UPI0037354449